MGYRAVIFDLGGVVLPSPFEAWAEYEHELGLPVGFIRGVVAANGSSGAWARHERGEVSFEQFCRSFELECEEAGGCVDGAKVIGRLATMQGPRPEMLTAIARIRDHGLKTGALTNNWASEGDVSMTDALGSIFDVVVESSVTGLRKPDPRIYLLVCEQLGVEPAASIFLDDLGVNLKPARELGMATIKVVDPARALGGREALLGRPVP